MRRGRSWPLATKGKAVNSIYTALGPVRLLQRVKSGDNYGSPPSVVFVPLLGLSMSISISIREGISYLISR